MSRKLAILAVVSLGGLGVAAMVYAQNVPASRPPSLTERLGQIRDQLVGGADDEAAEARGRQRPPTDWSAGRKIGMSSPSRSEDEEGPATSRRGATPYMPAQAQPPRSAPGTRIGPQPSTPGRSGQPAAATGAPAYTAQRTPPVNPTSQSARTTSQLPTASPAVATSLPAATPRVSSGGVSADSPLKNRLQALQSERFDEVVAGDKLSPASPPQAAHSSPAATRPAAPQESASTATADNRWRSAAPAARIDDASARETAGAQSSLEATVPAAAAATTAASGDTRSTDASSSGKTSADTGSADTGSADTDSGDKANRYASSRIGAAPSTARQPAPAAASEEPAARVARREATGPAMRNSIRDDANHSGAARTADANREGPAAAGALLASKSPILSVRTVGPRTVTIGKPATYQLLLENSGDAAANEVLVTVKLPAWAEIESAQATAGVAKAPAKQATAEGLQWRVSRLDPGGKQRLVMQVVPRQSTPFQLAVQWTFVPEVAKTVVEVQEPKLQIALDGPKEMLYGASEVYRITLSNPGTGDAENVTVLTSTSSAAKDGMNKLSVGTLSAGATKTLELKIDAAQAGTLHVAAKATADGDLASEAAADVLVRRAALKLVASGPQANYAGTQATFEARLANPGNATAENVRVEAALPIGAKFEKCSAGGAPTADGTKVVWTIPTLAAGSERAIELTCTLMAAGANRLQVAASAAGQLSDAAEVATRVEALADLKLEVSDPRGPVAVGADAVYEVRIRNRGTKSAERVNVVGFFSEGIEPVAASGAKYTVEPGQVTFATIDSVDPNEEIVCKITARASQPGNHVFRAELACQSTGTRLVVEEATLFYGDGPVKAAAHVEPVEDGLGNGDGSLSTGGEVPDLAPPTEYDQPRPLSLLDD